MLSDYLSEICNEESLVAFDLLPDSGCLVLDGQINKHRGQLGPGAVHRGNRIMMKARLRRLRRGDQGIHIEADLILKWKGSGTLEVDVL